MTNSPDSSQTLLAIGDIQGCLAEFDELLARAPAVPRLVLLGDLVNRGPQSAATLRRIIGLGERAVALLGNHDLHLLAVAAGVRPLHEEDTVADVLGAPDRDALLDWLRHRPLAWREAGALFVHAGVLPEWTAAQVMELAAEVETGLRGDGWRAFLASMYGNRPARWDQSLQGADRTRCVINALTRLRFVDASGAMDLKIKDTGGSAPPGFMPWFEHPQRQTRGQPVFFGHWSTLGLMLRDDLVGLDTGCVWGRQLSGLTWPDRRLIQVESRQPRKFG